MVKQIGSGRPALLLHSSMSSHRQWLTLTSALSLSHLCLLPDLAGYGGHSVPMRQPWSLSDEAQRILDGLPTQVRQHPIDVIGHSYGGAVALHLVRSGKLQVKKLVLFEPVPFHLLAQLPDAAREWQEITALAAELPTLSASCAAARFIDFWQQEGFFASLPLRMQQQLAGQVAKVNLDFQALSQEAATLADYAGTVQCPVLLLTGSRSRAPAQRIARSLSEVLPNAEVLTIDAGHMAPVTHPELVNPAIVQFLRA